MKFAKLLLTVSRRLQSVVDRDDFLVFVISLFHPGDCIPDSVSVHDIFCVITKNGLWNYVNYFPLKQIIEEFASEDVQLSESVRQYEEAVSGFLLCTKISEHVDTVDSDKQLKEKSSKYDAQYYHRLSLIVKAEVNESSMQYVRELWESLTCHYDLPSLEAVLDSVMLLSHVSNVFIIWLILILLRKSVDLMCVTVSVVMYS